jgi:geranyl-CoA carboxylase alpha subunit
MSFGSVLIANRTEIALRVGRTLRDMGLRWVGVFAPDDAAAPHARAADLAVAVPSYLDIPALIAAARACGAEAVHPGYGFLSENPDFAQAVLDAGLVWIGPPPAAMRLMADKGAAKRAMAAAGVPVLPGHDGDDQSDAALIAAGRGVGFPLMVKAAAGGGGRGMRLVHAPDDLPAALARARSEAAKAFGNPRLILERAVPNARHVEVQVMADSHGGVIHLGERECSIQRRHQKLIEEAPSPAVDAPLRDRLCAAAIAAARACDYRGAGTVEFLLAGDQFHFLEMNTRLQVEHPVTEAITGLDLVALQIRVAQGLALPDQSEIRFSGHAIEARLCAEDAGAGFLPQTGTVLHWAPPPGLRTDHALEPGLAIGTGYDSLLAKPVAHGPDRDTARRRLIAGLAATQVLGLATNRAFLAAVLSHPVFATGGATTGFLDQDFAGHPTLSPQPPDPETLALAAALFAHRAAGAQGLGHPRFGWSNAAPLTRRTKVQTGGQVHALPMTLSRDGAALSVRTDAARLHSLALDEGKIRFAHDGLHRALPFVWDGDTLWLADRAFRDATHDPATRTGATASGRVTAPMAGTLIAVPVAEGQTVGLGDTLAVIEAMKMEHPLRAPRAGRGTGLTARPGQQVAARQPLLTIEDEA